MLKELLISEIIKKGIDASSNAISKLFTDEQLIPSLNFEKNVEVELNHHLTLVDSWSTQISMRGFSASKDLDDLIIEPTFTSKRFEPNSNTNKQQLPSLTLEDILTSSQHVVVLGQPGAGKTTTTKKICQYLLHEEPKYGEHYNFPVLIRLRELSSNESIVSYLIALFGFNVSITEKGIEPIQRPNQKSKKFDPESFQRKIDQLSERVITSFLNSSSAVLILDGLDELATDHSLILQREIQRLCNLLGNAKIILTARFGSLDSVFDNSTTLFIEKFSEEKIKAYVKNWFSDDEAGNNFLNQVAKSPYSDTVGIPLTLVNLCMVFDAYGELPSPPVIIYQKIIYLLLEDWDRQRNIRRVSKYGKFGPDRKRQFLSAMAFELSKNTAQSYFYHGDLKRIYRDIHDVFGLPFEDREDVLREIESHTGLIVAGQLDSFEFTHKSLQEYLAADYISRLTDLSPYIDHIFSMPNECAISTVLSANPANLFSFLVKSSVANFNAPETSLFWVQYLERLFVEQVHFPLNDDFGLAYLTLMSAALQSQNSENTHSAEFAHNNAAIAKSLSSLASFNNVSESVSLWYEKFLVRRANDGFLDLRPKGIYSNQMPDWAPKKLLIWDFMWDANHTEVV